VIKPAYSVFPIINKYLCMAKRSLLSERPSYFFPCCCVRSVVRAANGQRRHTTSLRMRSSEILPLCACSARICHLSAHAQNRDALRNTARCTRKVIDRADRFERKLDTFIVLYFCKTLQCRIP